MSATVLVILVALIGVLAAGLGWAFARLRHAERAERERGTGSGLALPQPPGNTEPAARALATPTPAPPLRVEPPKPEAIVIGTAQQPVATLTRAEHHRPARLVPIDLPRDARESLAPLLQQAPRVLAMAGSLASDATKYVMKFSPEAARGLAAGTLEITRAAGGSDVREMARDVLTKRFVEHAQLVQVVNPVAVAAAVWQFAAIVTAQKFLADINLRLASVERGIAAIQSFLEDNVRAQLRTSAVRLREMADAVRDQRLSPRELDTLAHQLESIDREAQQVTELYGLQLDRASADLAGQDWSVVWSTKDEVKAAAQVYDQVGARSSAYLTSVEIRTIASMMRGAFGLDAQLAEARLVQVKADLARHEKLLLKITSGTATKLTGLKATFQFGSTDDAHRAKIRAALSEAVDPAVAAREHLQHVVENATSLLRSNAAEAAAAHELERELAPDGTILSAARRLPA
jgi:hypothetical protein